MNKTKRACTLALALMCAAGLSRAADPAARDWSGLYLGLGAGGGVGGKSEWNFPADGGANGNFAPQATGGAFSHSLGGSAWGLRFGENRQFGNLVVGVEAAYDWSNIDATSTNAFGAGTGPTTHKTRLKSLATLTPRVGYATGNWLPYAKAGLALAEVESSMTGTGGTFNQKHLHGGWTAGLGVEYAFASSAAGAWILGLEYNYNQFSGKDYGGQMVPDNTWPVQYKVKPDAQTVMARLTYNFGARAKGSSGAGSAATANWNGLYVGIDAGGAVGGTSEWNFPADGGGFGNFAPQATGGSLSHSPRGGAWGLHLGENAQFGNWVVGIEGGYAWTGIDETSTNAFGAATGPTTHKTRLKSLATLTPRVGYATGNWLPYAKAGLALAEVESSMTGTGGTTFNQKHLHDGWTVGLGVEYSVAASSAGAWVLGLEYNYYQFSGKNYGGQVVPDNTWPVQYSLKPDSQTILARLTHQFR